MRIVTLVIGVIALTGALVFDPAPLPAQEGTPAADCPTTTEDEYEALVLRWHQEAINGHDSDVIDEIVAPDIVHHAGTLPDGVGPDAVRKVLATLLTGFPDVKHTIDDTVTEDDIVVVRWTAGGTQTGEFQGYAPTGRPATWTGINIYRIACGRIAEEWSEVDGIGRLQQLGVMATPAPR